VVKLQISDNLITYVMPRLGVIIPSSNTTVEYEFTKALVDSEVSCHFARVPLRDVTVQGLECMEETLDGAAVLLRDADIDLVAFACTSGSLIEGMGYDLELAKRISDAAGCPALTTSGAVIDALNALGAKKICLATPYLEEVTDREVSFLVENGFSVLKSRSLGIKENLKIGQLSPSSAQTLAQQVFSDEADALFVSCTNFRTFEAVPVLERQLGKPVISSNSATLWASLKAVNKAIALPLGQLFCDS
jgi:maleate isomerase